MLPHLMFLLLAAAPPSTDVDTELARGRALHDAGDYDGAIRAYEAVLSRSPKNREAAYERLFSTWSKHDLARARVLGEAILKSDDDPLPGVYIVLGSTCDDAGDRKAALSVFKKGIKRHPESAGLHFNLGITLAATAELKDSATELRQALMLTPQHPGSWLQLGLVENKLGEPGYALAAVARFLSLEPASARSAGPARSLNELLMAGVTRDEPKDGKGQIKVTLPSDKLSTTGGTQAAMLALAGATRYGDAWKGKTDPEFFAYGLDAALAMLSEAQPVDDTARFWKGCAFDFFDAARAAGHMPALAYDARRSLGDPEITDWLSAHSKESDAYRTWSRAWKPASCPAVLRAGALYRPAAAAAGAVAPVIAARRSPTCWRHIA
jgi:tetratricopeptide (TPR) repeat protein